MRFIEKSFRKTDDKTPSWWNSLLSVLKTMGSGFQTLDGIEDHALHFSVIQTYSDQLDQLKQANHDFWRAELEIEWCNAELYLFALTFTMAAITSATDNTQMQIHPQIILQKTTEGASNLIVQFHEVQSYRCIETATRWPTQVHPRALFHIPLQCSDISLQIHENIYDSCSSTKKSGPGLHHRSTQDIFQSHPGRR